MSGDHHLSWGAQALQRQLTPLLPGVAVEVLARTDSTNSELLARARGSARLDDGRRQSDAADRPAGRRSDDRPLPCLLVAEQQTAGRGRNGRPWSSGVGVSLTFSLSLSMQPADWSGLSLAVGVSLAQALDPDPDSDREGEREGSREGKRAASHLRLKWPNDLWLCDAQPSENPSAPGRKLGGILIETVAAPTSLGSGDARVVVVGIGLNVLPQSLVGLDTGFACLQELDPSITAPNALARVALPLVLALQRFEREGFAAFAEGFASRDLLRGLAVTTTSAALTEGIADGVDAGGALRLRRGAQLHRIVAGEVSVRPAGRRDQEPARC